MIVSEVIDCKVGDVHVTPEQIMDVNMGTYGEDDCVLPMGQKLAAQVLTNNTVRIFDGTMVYCGVRDNIPVNKYYDVTIDNGSQGMFRHDIIVRHFEKQEGTGYATASFRVIKGTPSASSAADPEIEITNLRTGSLTHNMLLYRVELDGLNITAVTPLFETLIKLSDIKGLLDEYTEIMACTKRGFVPDALAVKSGFTQLNANLGTVNSKVTRFHSASFIQAPDEKGCISVDVRKFNLAVTPNVAIGLLQSKDGFLRYDYDLSSKDYVKLKALDSNGEPISGNVRFCIFIIDGGNIW